jgi:hypothetical protein
MYLTPRQVQKRFGYHPKTLAIWADEGKVQAFFGVSEKPTPYPLGLV